jgi:hypothetical protein
MEADYGEVDMLNDSMDLDMNNGDIHMSTDDIELNMEN